MKKLCIQVILLFLLFPSAAIAEDYQKFWRGLPEESKLVLLTSYLRGYYDGSCGFPYIYRKVFNEVLDIEQVKRAEQFFLVPVGAIPQVRTGVFQFMEEAYKADKYANVNVYDMMSMGVTCVKNKITPGECLFLNEDFLLKK